MDDNKQVLEELRQEAKALIMELADDECGYILDELRRLRNGGTPDTGGDSDSAVELFDLP